MIQTDLWMTAKWQKLSHRVTPTPDYCREFDQYAAARILV